jgi:Fis family transcriptional regulator
MTSDRRKYFTSSVYDLVEIFSKNKLNKNILEEIMNELNHRRSKTAVKLKKEIEVYLSSESQINGDDKFMVLVDRGREVGFLTHEDINNYLQLSGKNIDELSKIISIVNDLGLQVHEVTPSNYEILKSQSDAEHDIERSIGGYFLQLDDKNNISSLYDEVLNIVEPTLLKLVLNYTNDNQSETARILGLNRTTLRTKIKKYELDYKI